MRIYIRHKEEYFELYEDENTGACLVYPDPRILDTQKIVEALFGSCIVNTEEVPDTEGQYHDFELAMPVPPGVRPIDIAIFLEHSLGSLTGHVLYFRVDYEYE